MSHKDVVWLLIGSAVVTRLPHVVATLHTLTHSSTPLIRPQHTTLMHLHAHPALKQPSPLLLQVHVEGADP